LLVRFLKDWDRGRRAEVDCVKQPVLPDGSPDGEPIVYEACAVVDWDDGDVDTSSSEAAMLTITLQPRGKS
jgi:hypothetical protein